MFKVRNIEIGDYLKVRDMCLKNLNASKVASPEEKIVQSNFTLFDAWFKGKYRICVEKDGVFVGFFYAYPLPKDSPKEVEILAWAMDPELPDEDKIKGGVELLKKAYADYSAVGTEVGYGNYWADDTCKVVLDALKLSGEPSGWEPITHETKIIRAELVIDDIKKQIDEWEANQ